MKYPGDLLHEAAILRSSHRNFSAGRYIAVPMLQWLGMAYDERHAAEAGVVTYPTMTRWLRQS